MAGNFHLVPLSDVLGAEVRGLDITEDLDDRTIKALEEVWACLLYTSPSPRVRGCCRMPSSG